VLEPGVGESFQGRALARALDHARREVDPERLAVGSLARGDARGLSAAAADVQDALGRLDGCGREQMRSEVPGGLVVEAFVVGPVLTLGTIPAARLLDVHDPFAHPCLHALWSPMDQ